MARGRRRGVALESIDRGGAGRGEMLGLVSVREKQGERRGISSAARPRERERWKMGEDFCFGIKQVCCGAM